MSIRYLTSLNRITADHLQGFFEGWPNPPSPETHLQMLRGSSHVVLAMDVESDCVIGFINAICDGSHFAFIPLLEVLPAYRRRDIGSELVRRLLERLEGYYAIDLMCDEPVQPFYEQLGFSHATGMMLRNHARQASGTMPP